MTIMHTCNCEIKRGRAYYTCPVEGCGFKAVMILEKGYFFVTDKSAMGALHDGGSGGVNMGPAEVRQDAGPIPDDYHVDADLIARELDLGREDWR